jgi:ABC-2 type transport system permease protein
MRNSRLLTILLIALVVLFGNHLAFQVLEGTRIDLTADDLYSLSDGSRQILQRMIDEGVKPIEIDLFFSQTTGKTLPRFIKNFVTYERYLRSLLQEYERASKGKVKVRFIDPVTDSDEAEDALDFGLDGKAINQEGDLFFFGLVFQTQTGSRDSIEFLWPNQQETIEYEISKKIHSLLWPSGKTIGILSSLEVLGGADNPYLAQMLAAQGRTPAEKWLAMRVLEESYEVRQIDSGTDHISPEEFDLVVVIHPKGLQTRALWALDEWIARGGNALIFLDPYALDDRPPQDPQQPWQSLQYRPASELEELLQAWGLEMPVDRFAADLDLAVRRAVGPRGPAETVVVDLAIDESTREATLDTSHPVLQGISRLRFLLAGALEAKNSEGPVKTLLVGTTESGSTLQIEPGFGDGETLAYTDLNNPSRLRDELVTEAGHRVALGYQISGRIPSAFPEGVEFVVGEPETPPGLPPGVELPPPADGERIRKEPVPEAERADATVLVFSDVDVLSDAIAFERNFLGLAMSANDNHKLLLNSVDFLLGAKELMAVRAKHSIQRPFTLFDEIEATAEKESLDRERQLREEVEAAEEELRAKRQELSGQNAALFQKRLQDEVDRLNERVKQGNRELREIRKARREALEKEEARVRRSVMGWMPTLVLAVGLVLAVRRRQKHQRALGR